MKRSRSSSKSGKRLIKFWVSTSKKRKSRKRSSCSKGRCS